MQAAISRFFKQEYIFVLAALSTLVVYSGFFGYGHISWDDPEMVFKNEAVQQFDLKAFFSNQYVGNYIPITMLFHSLTWQLFGDWNAGHHFLNLLFHVINGFLLLQISKKIFGNSTISHTAVVLFLLHPLQVESVGWISEFKTILATTFYFSALLVFLRWQAQQQIKYLLFCFLLFVLGCLSKPSVVVLPISFLCFELFIQKKINPKTILILVPFFVVSIVAGLVNIEAQTEAQFINHAHEFPYWQRTAFAGFALLKYFILFVFPSDLSIIYPYPEQKVSVYVLGFLALLAIAGMMYFLFKNKIFEWLSILVFVLVNLILVLQLLPFGEVLYADRYMYVAIVGLSWIAGWFIQKIKFNASNVALSLIVLFGILTYGRTLAWKSALSLYEDILEKHPNEFIALNSAGVECMFLNEDKKALDYFNKATTTSPNNYKGFYNRGLLYLKNERPNEAVLSFNASIDLYEYPKAYAARASAYYQLNDMSKAIQDAKHALALDSNNSTAYFVMANCFNQLNQLEDAMTYYNKALQIDPSEPDYYFKRAVVYGKKQDFRSSLSDLDLCISLKSDYYEAYFWRAVSKINLKLDPCADLNIAARHNYEPAVDAFNKYCR